MVGCGKLWRHSPEAVETYGLIDVLYSAVRDPDNQVMAFALQTLNVVLESEGGVVINLHMTNYLLQRSARLKLRYSVQGPRVLIISAIHVSDSMTARPWKRCS